MDSLYIGAIQRDFSKELNENEEKEIANNAGILVESLLFKHTFNRQIQEWAEIAVNKCESSKERDFASSAINIILMVEMAFKDLVPERESEEVVDIYNPL